MYPVSWQFPYIFVMITSVCSEREWTCHERGTVTEVAYKVFDSSRLSEIIHLTLVLKLSFLLSIFLVIYVDFPMFFLL